MHSTAKWERLFSATAVAATAMSTFGSRRLLPGGRHCPDNTLFSRGGLDQCAGDLQSTSSFETFGWSSWAAVAPPPGLLRTKLKKPVLVGLMLSRRSLQNNAFSLAPSIDTTIKGALFSLGQSKSQPFVEPFQVS